MKRLCYATLIIAVAAALVPTTSFSTSPSRWAGPPSVQVTPVAAGNEGTTTALVPFLLAESHLRYATTIDSFDVQTFLETQHSFLANQVIPDEAGESTIAQAITEESTANGINPRVLLALIQIRSGAITGRPDEVGEFRPLVGPSTQTLSTQGVAAEIAWASSKLNESLERGKWEPDPLVVTLGEGDVRDLRSATNPSSYAVYELASLWGIADWYARLTDESAGFVAIYEQWFGNPLDQPTFLPTVAPTVSTNWLIPYESTTVKYTGGPHAYGPPLEPPEWYTGICLPMLRIDAGALDFAMGEGTHVLSIDSGYVRHIQYYSGAAAHVVVIEHDSGIASYYIHMKARNPALTVGMRIPRGFYLGDEGDGNGQWPFHLHLEIREGGKDDWWGANSGSPVSWESLQIDGWEVGMHQQSGTSQGYAYQGSAVQGSSMRKLLKTTQSSCSGRPLANMLVSTDYPVDEDDENNERDPRTVFAGADPENRERTLRSHNLETDQLLPDAVDVALIIDSSGSMGQNDAQGRRKEAAKAFIDAMQDDDQISVIDFDDSIKVSWSLQRVGSDRSLPRAAVDTIDSSGNTNILGALQTGLNQLNASTVNNPKAAVFLTDGDDTVGNSDTDILNVAASYAAKGWRVFTIGLIGSGQVNESLLQQIATNTGGQYSRLSTPQQLVSVYFEILGKVTGGTTIHRQTTVLQPGETKIASVVMPDGKTTANFLTTWQGSAVDTVLIDPNGRVITPSIASQDPDIDHQKGLTYELYRVTRPQPGNWQVSIYGADLPTGGEEVSVQVAVRSPGGVVDLLPDKFLFSIGAQAPIGKFMAPQGVAVAPDGTVYVADSENHRIQRFSATGTFLGTWGTLGSGDGQFWGPVGVSVGPDGTVYVADTKNHRIQCFSAVGSFVRKWGSQGTSDGQFWNPAGVALAQDGTVYVSDTDNHRIQHFSATGAFLSKWGSQGANDGQMNSPQGHNRGAGWNGLCFRYAEPPCSALQCVRFIPEQVGDPRYWRCAVQHPNRNLGRLSTSVRSRHVELSRPGFHA